MLSGASCVEIRDGDWTGILRLSYLYLGSQLLAESNMPFEVSGSRDVVGEDHV